MPGFFGGYDDAKGTAEFDALWDKVLFFESYWCCASWGDADRDYARFYYARPPRLAGAAGAA